MVTTFLKAWFYLVFPILFQSINMLVYWLALKIRFIDRSLDIRGPLATVNSLLGLFYVMLFLVLQVFKPDVFADLYPTVFYNGDLPAWPLFRGTAWVAMVTFLTHWTLLKLKGSLPFIQSFKIAAGCTAFAYLFTVLLCAALF